MQTLLANDLTSEEISCRPLFSACLTIGTISPIGVCTAMLISAELYCRMKSPCHEEFTSGTFLKA